MTEETKKAPVMRFQGFSDDWEQRKLSDMTEYKNGKGHEDKQRTHGKYELINLNSISIDGGLKHSGKYIDDANETLKKYDLVMVLSDIGHGDLLGRVALIPEDNRFVLNQRVALLRPKSLFNPLFLFSYINQHQKYFKNQGAGMSQLNISRGSVESFSSYVPSAEEQTKIGTFFKQLDDTIALHQRKLTLLKQLKQTYLQALFPQSELNIPTLRFARFSDSWEQRKVSSLAKETFGGGTPKTGVKKYWKGSFPWIQSSDLTTNQLHNVQPTKFITEEAIKQSATHNVPGNSIAIVTRVGVGKLALMRSSYSTSQDFLSLSNLNVDAVFGVYCLYKMLQREVNNIQGTSIKGITKADLLEKCVSVPTKVEEQVKIGAFFKKIDDTIDFHESKLKHILELKKAFLEKMFL